MSFPNERTYSFDANMVLSDNAAAYVASGYMQAGGADGLLDLGGNQSASPKQQARIDAVLVCDVTALDITSGDERYRLKVLVSNDPAFAAGNVVSAGGMELGKGSAGVPNTQMDSVTGRYELQFATEIAGTKYQYAKGYIEIAGTTPSINVLAYVAVTPEP